MTDIQRQVRDFGGKTAEKSIYLPGCVKPDTTRRIHFYENDFYVLSNFSAFSILWDGYRFPTPEHAYHYEKFRLPQRKNMSDLQFHILNAISAHEAFKLAEKNKPLLRTDWDEVKLEVMRKILLEKTNQHEYVMKKLIATGDRELVEDSWRDDFWGWGPNRDGNNALGKLWMEIRQQITKGI